MSSTEPFNLLLRCTSDCVHSSEKEASVDDQIDICISRPSAQARRFDHVPMEPAGLVRRGPDNADRAAAVTDLVIDRTVNAADDGSERWRLTSSRSWLLL